MTKRYKTLRNITNYYKSLRSAKHYRTLQTITSTTHYKRRAGVESTVSESTAFGALEGGQEDEDGTKQYGRAPSEAPDGRLALAVADRGLGYPASESAGGESGREARIWFQGTVAEARFAVSARTLLLDPPGRTFYNPRPRS